MLNNWGPPARVTVQFPPSARAVTNAITGPDVPINRGVAVVDLEEGASAVLIARPSL
ncbi:MAG TPA: hypothetical protein VN633_00265 [Bryobacteraceae bacterium]|nr:hypothetical protein [Bryobacteraceae bacterium]